ncbi:MAG: Septum formation initiator [Bacteriovoracaceae bacterium]|nr:Septum formation initiator [Bacteriovoracaceae bacterium]
MSSRTLWGFSSILIIVVLVGTIYSRHGFFDLRRIQRQIKNTRDQAAQVEMENQKLKRQVGLFEKPSNDLIEREVRDVLGWVKSNEIVYLEKSK